MPPRRKTVDNARELRREMSPPEVALWQWLRTRPPGLKFRRQHPAGPYVLDFYCASTKLAIEVDGAFHDLTLQVAYDVRRDAWLRAQGMRIKAVDVLDDLENVTLHILNHCGAYSPPPSCGWSPSQSNDREDH